MKLRKFWFISGNAYRELVTQSLVTELVAGDFLRGFYPQDI